MILTDASAVKTLLGICSVEVHGELLPVANAGIRGNEDKGVACFCGSKDCGVRITSS